jgi:hypothetical protein
MCTEECILKNQRKRAHAYLGWTVFDYAYSLVDEYSRLRDLNDWCRKYKLPVQSYTWLVL